MAIVWLSVTCHIVDQILFTCDCYRWEDIYSLAGVCVRSHGMIIIGLECSSTTFTKCQNSNLKQIALICGVFVRGSLNPLRLLFFVFLHLTWHEALSLGNSVEHCVGKQPITFFYQRGVQRWLHLGTSESGWQKTFCFVKFIPSKCCKLTLKGQCKFFTMPEENFESHSFQML